MISKLKMISCRGQTALFESVLTQLGLPIKDFELGSFMDKETFIKIHFDPINKDFLVLQVL